jgi:streptogramin lyase
LTTITEYSLPLVNGSNAQPSEIASGASGGPTGKLWFIAAQGNEIGSVSTTNPDPHPYPASLGTGANAEGITTDSVGDVWFTENGANQIGFISLPDMLNHTIQYFGTAQGMSANAGPAGIVLADGFVWFTESSADKIGRVDPASGKITEYDAPAAMTGQNSRIVLGADGNLWFTELGAIGIFNPQTHSVVKEVSLPGGLPELPLGITAGPKGTIWYTAGVVNAGGQGFSAYAVGGINTCSRALIPEIALGASSAPEGITAGGDGYVWFTEAGTRGVAATRAVAGTIEVINPSTDKIIDTLALPTNVVTNPDPVAITGGPDGNIWFADSADPTGAIGRVALDTRLAISLQPPQAVGVGSQFPVSVGVNYSDTGASDSDYNGNVTLALIANPGGATLLGRLTETVVNGSVTFEVSLNKPGSGYTLEAMAPGSTSVVSSQFNVVAPSTATQLVVTAQPAGSGGSSQFGIRAGAGFTVVVAAETSSLAVDPNFNGFVTIGLAKNPGGSTLGGTLTVKAVSGVATFTGLTLNQAGENYTLTATSSGLTSVTTTPFRVFSPPSPPPVIPTVIREAVLHTQKRNKKGKAVGRAVLSGFELDFNVAMNPASVSKLGNYQVGFYATRRVKRKTVRSVHPVAVSVTFDAAKDSVMLTLAGKVSFPKGGQITLNGAPPAGIASSAGVFLEGSNQSAGGDETFTITPDARSVTAAVASQ